MRILYNSLETRYKTPFGTLFPRQDCRMRLAIPASCQTRQVTLVVEQENGALAFSVSFSLQQREGPYEWYGGTFQIANLGLYFYYFRIETANETFRLFQQGEDTNMEAGGKWQLSCVTDRYPVPAYAQGAVMYQVFPDRFSRLGSQTLPKSWRRSASMQTGPKRRTIARMRMVSSATAIFMAATSPGSQQSCRICAISASRCST